MDGGFISQLLKETLLKPFQLSAPQDNLYTLSESIPSFSEGTLFPFQARHDGQLHCPCNRTYKRTLKSGCIGQQGFPLIDPIPE
jgi:hypothetical protein